MTIIEQTVSRVSFAVRLLDDFSGLPRLIDTTRVFIKEDGKTALQNPSGYHVFTGVTETNVTIRVENRYYFAKEAGINIPALNPRNPMTAVTMKPNGLYPFPLGSTLVRGVIRDAGNSPIQGAQVSVVGRAITNESGADGRFVLYWGPLDEDDISVVNHHRHLKINNSTTIKLNVNHPSFKAQIVTIGVVIEGELKLLTAPIIVSP